MTDTSQTTAGAVTVACEGAVTIVTLNEPETRNALTPRLRDALFDAVSAAMADDACRVLILTGAGPAFCAGGDLASLPDHDPVPLRRRLSRTHELMRLLIAGPKPVIAAVNGPAVGAGLSIAVACDFVLATDAARFGAVFGRVGLMADMGLLWTLPQRIGIPATRRLVLTAATLDADAALAMGLVDERVSADALLVEALKLAHEMAAAPPLAVAATRALLAQGPATLDQTLNGEMDKQVLLFSSQDFVEGRRAFMERRKPVFSGR